MLNKRNIVFYVLMIVAIAYNIQAEQMTPEIARQILSVKNDTTSAEIEQAYYKLSAKQHAVIKSASVVRTYFDDESVVRIYGTTWKYESSVYRMHDDQVRDEIFRSKETLKKLRLAYECLSAMPLEKVKLLPQEIDTRGLKLHSVDFNLNYDMSGDEKNIRDANWNLLQKNWEWKDKGKCYRKSVNLHDSILRLRKDNKAQLVENQDEDYFVLGESGQDELLFAKQVKDQTVIDRHNFIKNKRQAVIDNSYADGGDNCIIVGTVIAVAGLFVRSIFLDK